MNIKKLEKAIALSTKAAALLKTSNDELRSHFDSDEIDIFYQASDGWCVLFDGDKNTCLKDIDLSHLLTLTYEDACEYLGKFSI